MASDTNGEAHNPRYDRRVMLATRAIQEHSDLPEQKARELAAHVVYALDHIPEHLR